MRALILTATALAMSAGVGGIAAAADLPLGLPAAGGVYDGYVVAGQRAPQRIIYDDEPGVSLRAYWRAPWRNRRYFPMTGERPVMGRDEDLSAPDASFDISERFDRSWSTSSAFRHEWPRERVDDTFEPSPSAPAPLK